MLEQFKDAMSKWYAEMLGDINPYDEKGVDENTFIGEARAIIDGFIKAETKNKYTAADVIQPTFKVMRGRPLSVQKCEDAVCELIDTVKTAEDSIPFYEDDELKGRMVDGNITPVMKVAEHFIVDSFSVGRKSYVYINERLYTIISKKRAIDLYKSLLNDDETVYVQYKRPLPNGLEGSYTKRVKKSKYSYDRLKKKENIVGIFDRQSKYDMK